MPLAPHPSVRWLITYTYRVLVFRDGKEIIGLLETTTELRSEHPAIFLSNSNKSDHAWVVSEHQEEDTHKTVVYIMYAQPVFERTLNEEQEEWLPVSGD